MICVDALSGAHLDAPLYNHQAFPQSRPQLRLSPAPPPLMQQIGLLTPGNRKALLVSATVTRTIVIVFYVTIQWMLYCWSQGLPLWWQPQQPPPERLLPPPQQQPTTPPRTLLHPMECTVRHPGVPQPIVRSPSNIELAPMLQQGQIGVAI